MFLFFFFFDHENEIKPGTVCKVNSGRYGPEHRVVVHQVHKESFGTFYWTYINEPVSYRVNKLGHTVLDHDPACMLSIYVSKELIPTNEIPLQTDGWGAKYRRERMF